MSQQQPVRSSRPGRVIRKYFVSAFVVGTFVAYAIHERSSNSDNAVGVIATTSYAPATQQAPVAPTAPPPTFPPTFQPAIQPTAQPTQSIPTAAPTDVPPTPAPTDAPAPSTATPFPQPSVAGQQYKNGSFTGSVADAWFGSVQVEAVIQDGKIADVQFLDYPHDRRTSVRINTVANPRLVSEVIQAQSAQVDVVSGATLTSQAFIESLQTALDSAKA